jgi:Zn-dependent peptidase ImmA (M78 family)
MDVAKISNQMVTSYLDSLALTSVPVNIEAIARQHGVSSIESRRINMEGYLGRLPNQELVIRVKAESRHERQRFTIAHEVGHIIIAHLTGRPIQGLIAHRRERDDAEERLANRIAARLLIPESQIAEDLLASEPRWRTIRQLAQEYRVSVSCMLHRVREVNALFALDFAIELKDDLSDSILGFRIAYSGNRNLRFLRPPQTEALSLVQRRRQNRAQSLVVDIGGHVCEMQCDGRTCRGQRAGQIYHVIGWRRAEDKPQRM